MSPEPARKSEVIVKEPSKAADPTKGTVASGEPVQLGRLNLTQLHQHFVEQAAEIGTIVKEARVGAAKKWVPLLRTNREIILQNEKVVAKARITNEMRSAILIEQGAVETRGGTMTRTTGAMSRPNALTRWSFSDLMTNKDEIRALKNGVKYGDQVFMTPIEMLEGTDESMSRVYEFFSEKVAAVRQNKQRNKLPTDIPAAVEKSIENLGLRKRVPKDAAHPKGYEQVKLVDFPEAAFFTMKALLTRHAGAWTEDQRSEFKTLVDLPKPEPAEPGEGDEPEEEEE